MPYNTRTESCLRIFALAVLLFPAVPAGAGVVLAQNDNGDSSRQEIMPGTLVMPGEDRKEASEKKKCMTVCARWGEECTYINRGAGGTTRKCRRTCKQFTEECF